MMWSQGTWESATVHVYVHVAHAGAFARSPGYDRLHITKALLSPHPPQALLSPQNLSPSSPLLFFDSLIQDSDPGTFLPECLFATHVHTPWPRCQPSMVLMGGVPGNTGR